MSADAAADWNRLAEIYRQKSDDELEIIASEAYDLTDIAREVLSAEIEGRHLAFKLATHPSAPDRPNPYADDAEDAFQLATVYNADTPEQLLTVTRILEDVDTPYVIGDENVERPEDYKGSFDKGVAIKVAFCEMPRINKILEDSLPSEMCDRDETPEPEQLDPTCPACHSKEIAFVCKDPLERDKFRWRCDSCKLMWIDDGVVK